MDFDEQDLPEQRTALAEDRTILANERTFASWMRTSLGCVAIGVGFHALFQRIDPPWVPQSIATVFLLIAIAVIILAERRAASFMTRLNAHVVIGARAMNLRLFAAVVTIASAALIGAIWLLPLR